MEGVPGGPAVRFERGDAMTGESGLGSIIASPGELMPFEDA
jgi:hypothetical protein